MGCLTTTEQGDDWIELAWKKPIDGGKPANYEVLVRERTDEDADYRTVATTIATDITLAGQEWGKELEYVVMAANRAGEGRGGGPIGNAVMAML